MALLVGGLFVGGFIGRWSVVFVVDGRCGRWYAVGAQVGVVGGMLFYTTPDITTDFNRKKDFLKKWILQS